MKHFIFAFALVFASVSPVFAQKGKAHKPAPSHPHVQQHKVYVAPHVVQQHKVIPHYNVHPNINHGQQHYNVRPVNNYYHGGAYYRGRNFNSWTNYCYFPAYRCYGYYYDYCWYYWYAPQNCFLPVYYMQTMPPVFDANTPLPAGAVPLQKDAPQVLNFDPPTYEILITVNGNIRDTGDMLKSVQNQSRIKAKTISKVAPGTYLVTVDSNLSYQEVCGTFSHLPHVIYAELNEKLQLQR